MACILGNPCVDSWRQSPFPNENATPSQAGLSWLGALFVNAGEQLDQLGNLDVTLRLEPVHDSYASGAVQAHAAGNTGLRDARVVSR